MSDFWQVCEDANGVYDDSGSIEGYMFKKGGLTRHVPLAILLV